jgi:type I restriction enzyme S subunit
MGSVENLQPYADYKDSGAEWLPRIPSGWEIKPLKSVALVNPSKLSKTVLDDDKVTFLPMEALHNDNTYEQRLEEYKKISSGYTSFQEGDLVLAKVTPCFENHKAAVMNNLPHGIGFGTTEIIAIRPILSKVSSAFLYYLISIPAFKEKGKGELKGIGGLRRVPTEFISSYKFPLPPLETQQRIVEFLDAETGRIDTLVSEMEALITMLQENRRVLIAETVTRGIPGEHTEFKDSGVEWLGQIPTSWELQKIARIAKFFTGGTPPTEKREYFDGNESWASIADLKDGILRETHKKISKAGIEKARIAISPTGSLLYSFKLSVGKVAITTFDTYTNEAIATFLPSKHIDTKYAFYSYPIFLIRNAKKNIYDADLLNADLINQAILPLPFIIEQQRIANYLDTETAKIDTLIAETTDAIRLLKEERKVLISDVVTGKVEV